MAKPVLFCADDKKKGKKGGGGGKRSGKKTSSTTKPGKTIKKGQTAADVLIKKRAMKKAKMNVFQGKKSKSKNWRKSSAKGKKVSFKEK